MMIFGSFARGRLAENTLKTGNEPEKLKLNTAEAVFASQSGKNAVSLIPTFIFFYANSCYGVS